MATRHGLVATAVVLALVAPAAAEGPKPEVLFREGKRLLKQGKVAEACEKVEASERLDATFSHEFVLAECRERNGQLATASAWFVKAADRAHATRGYGAREREARRRIAKLEPRIGHLQIVVDNLVEDLVISRDDAVLEPEAWNRRVAIDPGTYKISAQAPGHRSWSTDVEVAGDDQTVEVPELELDAEAAPEQPEPSERAPPTAEKPHAPADQPAPDQPPQTSGKRKLAIVIGGVGLIAGVAGVAYDVRANQQPADPGAGTSQTIAKIAIGTGGAALLSAVVLWAIGGSPATPSVSAAMVPGGATIVVGGRF
jgi:hypothetical protein